MTPDDDLIRRATANTRAALSAQARANALRPVDAARARRNELVMQGVRTTWLSPTGLAELEQQEQGFLDAIVRQRRAQEAGDRAPDLAPFLADQDYYARINDDLEPLSLMGAEASLLEVQAARRRGMLVPEYRAFVRNGGVRAPDVRGGTASAYRAPAPSLWNIIKGLGQSVVSGGEQVRAGLRMQVADLTGGSTDRYRRDILAAQADVEASTPLFETSTARAIYGGVSSLLQLAPAATVSAIIRNPTPVLTAAGAQTYFTRYGTYRVRGNDALGSGIGAGGEAVVEVATELLPAKFFVDALGRTGTGRAIIGYFARDIAGEQIATLYQDAMNVAMPGSGLTWQDYVESRPQAAYETFVSTLTQTALFGGANAVVRRAMQRHDDEATLDGIDQIMERAADSKVRADHPELFREIVERLLRGREGDTVYVEPEKVRELFQSEAELRQDAFWGSRIDALTEAEAAGQDLSIPIADLATALAGTPQWEQLKDQVRPSPMGEPRSEIDRANAEFEDAMNAAAEEAAGEIEAEREGLAPVVKIYEGMRDKLMLAGYRPDVASQLATLFAQRQRVRSERLGEELTGTEGAGVEVRRVLPPKLSSIIAAQSDVGLREVINELRRERGVRSERGMFGPSLLEFVRSKGGVADPGGDLQAMGAQSLKGRKKGAERLIGSQSLDDVALAAWEAGYFPELGERPSINDLLEAIREGISGRQRYASDTIGQEDELRMAAQELFALLDQAGVDPQTAPATEIQKVVQQYQAEFEQGRALEQSYEEGGARGRVTFTTDGRSVIDLFENRDLSTFIHESGHIFLEELRFDASLSGAPQQVKDDWKTVTDWFAANGVGLDENGNIPTEAHELWARGFERYAMEGKSPSAILRRAFDAFRSWLLSIYQVVENLRAPISPEMRDVMMRLLATEQEIEAAAEEQSLHALFDTADAAGMSEEDFAAYQDAASVARGEAFDALLYRTMRSIRAARSKEWREQEASVRAEVAAEIDAQPVFQALRLLRSTARLDRNFLLSVYGPGALDAMPKSVPPIYSDAGAVHPDVIADEAGFPSGDAMVQALMGYEETRKRLREAKDKRSPRQVAIDQGTQDRMAERYGDALRDGSIEEEALAAVHSEKQGELIEAELKALSRQRYGEQDPRAGRVTPYQMVKRWAEERIRSGKVSEVASGSAIQVYQRAARKAAKEAESAIAKRDLDEAYRQKQRQMINNALIAEARKAQDMVEAAVGRLSRTAARRTSKSIDQDYLEQAHALLERYDFSTRSVRDVEKQQAFEEWAAEREAEGHDVLIPPRWEDRLGRRHWSQLTVEEIAGLDDSVKQILHLGRHKQKLLDGAEERAFEDARAELIAAADGSGGGREITALNDPRRSLPERVKSFIRSADAAMVKVEQVVDWLDSNASNGPWNRLIFKPMADAQGVESDMLRSVTEKLGALIDAMPKEQARDWSREVETPELIDRVSADPELHGRAFRFGKDQIVMIAANWGNAGNRQRLLDGYGWKESDVRTVLDRLMTKEDWTFVQGVWDVFDSLREPLFAMERRVNGVEPEAVEAVAVDTPHGTFKGGYFPAVYDPAYSSETQRDEERKQLKGGFFRATTRASATKERAAAVKRPILLHTSVITAHVREVVHDIAHREAVIQVRKIMADGKIRAAVNRALGPEYVRAVDAWVEDIASPGIADQRTDGFIRAVGRHLHKGITMAGLGYRLSTVLVQPLGLANIAGVAGERATAEGTVKFWRNPLAAYREVTGKSAEMRDRFTTMDATIADMYGARAANKLQRFGPTAFEKGAFLGILYADMSITIGGWIGAYNKGLRDGLSEEEAIYFADKVIRTSQGAGAPKDKSSILRQNHLIRSFYPFFSYLNALYNQQRDTVRRARDGDVLGALQKGWWVAVVPAIVHAILFGPGPDEDDEEGWAKYLARMTLVAQTSSLPGVGQIANAMNSGWGYRATSLQRLGEGVERAKGDLTEEHRTNRSWIANMFEVIGIVTAKPLAAPGRAVEFGVDWLTGQEEPRSVLEAVEGFSEGRIRREAR